MTTALRSASCDGGSIKSLLHFLLWGRAPQTTEREFRLVIGAECPLFRGKRTVKPRPDIRISHMGGARVENAGALYAWQVAEWAATLSGPFARARPKSGKGGA